MQNFTVISLATLLVACTSSNGESESAATPAGSPAVNMAASSGAAAQALPMQPSTAVAGQNSAARAGSPLADAGSGEPLPGAGSESDSQNQATPATPAAPAAAQSDAGTSPAVSDWKPLVEGAWELPAGEEGYRCARLTVTEDLYIKEFQPIAPLGTHHTLLSVDEQPTAEDGISVCTSADLGHVTLLGSGVGENYSAGPLPDGVAYKVAKGSQLNLNLHLFNVSEATLRGVSGVKIRTTTADEVKQFAEVTLAGTLMLSIPRGKSSAMGKCTLRSDTTLFAVSPHMHQLGTRLKAIANRAKGDPVTLYDGPYDFNEQRQYPAGALTLHAGDTVQVECTYENTTDRTVMFGESSLDEMCFLGLYRYPLSGDALICAR